MGIDVAVGDLLGVFEDEFAGSRIISSVYLCTVACGEPHGADIIDEARWFPLSAPPPLAYPVVAEAITALRARLGI
jgi:ADP-ribose pyrophosphatase YjhB (NUDIX family)